MAEIIGPFEGEYRFLSNFHELGEPILFEGATYRTVEHAYQAAKTVNPLERQRIQAAMTAGRAKRLGATVRLRPNWDNLKVGIMRDLLRQKFRRNPYLREGLLATGEAELVELNWWGDTYWGVCKGEGENWLGKLLMELRGEWKDTERGERSESG